MIRLFTTFSNNIRLLQHYVGDQNMGPSPGHHLLIFYDFYYFDIWQCAIYFVVALFKELALITIIEMWGLGLGLELPGLGFYDKVSVSSRNWGVGLGGYGLDYITAGGIHLAFPCPCSAPLPLPADLHQHAWLLGRQHMHTFWRWWLTGQRCRCWRGARTDPCGTPFLRRRNLLLWQFRVVRVKLRLSTISMIMWTMCLSGSNCSSLQVRCCCKPPGPGSEHILGDEAVLFKASIIFLFCPWLHSKKLSIDKYWNCHLDE